MTQFLDDAFADYMIWKTAKGLRADNIVDAGVDKLQHFSSKEPSLSGLVPKGHNPFGVFSQVCDLGGRVKVNTCLQLLSGDAADRLQSSDPQVRNGGGGFLHSEVLRFKVGVVEAVE